MDKVLVCFLVIILSSVKQIIGIFLRNLLYKLFFNYGFININLYLNALKNFVQFRRQG